MSFHRGQLVVCIDDTGAQHRTLGPHSNGIRKGTVYTVRFWADGPTPVVWLEEVVRSDDAPYRASRFRPITRDRMKLFRDLLTPSPVLEDA